MIRQPQKYKVSIFGDSYSLISDEAEELVLASAHLVDGSMKEIAARLQSDDIQKIAVLVALRLALNTQAQASKMVSLIHQELAN